jgi:SAM-dependent methyltransferase
MRAYTPEYHQELEASARRSAEVVVPMLIELIRPTSVIDVGCGKGAWLAVFREEGVEDIWGVDGYVGPDLLEIPRDLFTFADLAEPLRLDRTFDLVVSLEVAEHLPESSARTFVDTLVGLGPVVLFSAAIPSQGGVNHVNEQWQDYWASIFETHDYQPIDCLRRKVWQHQDVEWWYAQNMILYARRDVLRSNPVLVREYELVGTSQLSLVHPRKYRYLLEWAQDHCRDV